MRKQKTVIERFCALYEMSESGCWIWKARLNETGYGIFGMPDRSKMRAHRLSYELFNGPITPGHYVCHKCDTPACVNPGHLFLGTQKQNMQDKCNKNRQRKGSAVPNSKLDNVSVGVIRDAVKAGYSQRKISLYFKICQQSVSLISRNINWRHVI